MVRAVKEKPRPRVQPKVKGGVLPNQKPVAIIDIGSNSVRLVVFEGANLTPISLFNEKILCGLGRELATTGKLGLDAVERALMALRRFRSIIDQIGVKDVRVIATAAAREARNGPKFIELAEEICRKKIEVISGVKEAELAAAGVLAGEFEADGFAGDMGGGSLELINIINAELADAVTLPLGVLRLIDQSEGDMKKAKQLTDKALQAIDWGAKGRGRPFYLVGGTWRAFIKMQMSAQQYPLNVLHGYKIGADTAKDFADFLINEETLKDLASASHVSKPRRQVLPFGALVLARLIDHIEPSEIITSNFGVREGLLYSLLSEAERKHDPLLAACEDLAILRSRSALHAFELCDWTDKLFVDGGVYETAEERRLRHAACLLSDIGWRTHASIRAKRTMETIAYSIFSSIDHVGRAFLALTSYFRHEGPNGTDKGNPFFSMVSEHQLERARLVGAAIRTAHVISAGVPKIIPKTPLNFDEEKLVIELPHPFDALDGERLDRRFSNLGKLINKETEIRVSKDSQFFGFLNFSL